MHRKAGGNPARECRKRGDDMPETWPGGRCSSPAGRSLQADPLGFLVEVQPHSHSKHLGKMAVMVRRTCVSKQVHTRRVRLARKENNMLRAALPAAAVEVKRRTYSRTDTFRAIWRSVIPVCPWRANHCTAGLAQICAAIPSKGRWERKDFIDHSVHILLKHGLRQRDIYVFVIEEEYDMYLHSLDEAALFEVHLIIGRDGLTAQMNYIRRFFQLAPSSWDAMTFWKTFCTSRKDIHRCPPCRPGCFCNGHTMRNL